MASTDQITLQKLEADIAKGNKDVLLQDWQSIQKYPEGARKQLLGGLTSDEIDRANNLLGKVLIQRNDEPARVKLPENATAFRAQDGSMIIEGELSGQSFYSSDGKTFNQLKITGIDGSTEKHKYDFRAPELGGNYRSWKRNGDRVDLDDGKVFEKCPKPSEIEVANLPSGRLGERLAELSRLQSARYQPDKSLGMSEQDLKAARLSAFEDVLVGSVTSGTKPHFMEAVKEVLAESFRTEIRDAGGATNLESQLNAKLMGSPYRFKIQMKYVGDLGASQVSVDVLDRASRVVEGFKSYGSSLR
jgi:hypothetical protein